jgi:LysM repeat protein
MRNNLTFLLELILITGLFSCKVYHPVISTPRSEAATGSSEESYINTYKDIAINEMKRTGIPASITLAQGMIESDYGRSRLAREANNHFGIKCHNDWTGATFHQNDDRRNECFRKYRKPEESFYDHSDFLKTVPRYNFLFNLAPTDYKGWAKGLKNAGYATNPDYANMLIRKIEGSNLTAYDNFYYASDSKRDTSIPVNQSVVPVNQSVASINSDNFQTSSATSILNKSVSARVPRVFENNRIQYIIVKDGDTKEKLENEFQLLRWELQKYNELKDNFQLVPGQILYLQPKREKAEPGKDYYITSDGDSMYLISQKFGIKLKSIYELNRIEEGSEPQAGTKIWLRSKKPVN